MAKERALDVFWLLDQIDRKNYHIWETLNEDQKKEFSPLVVMRWMAGMSDPMQLVFLNEIVNLSVFSLPEHKEFMLKLLAVCSNGRSKRYTWTNYKVGGSKKSKKSVQLLAEHLRVSEKDAADSLRLFSKEEIVELAEHHGWQKEELKELAKEFE